MWITSEDLNPVENPIVRIRVRCGDDYEGRLWSRNEEGIRYLPLHDFHSVAESSVPMLAWEVITSVEYLLQP